MKTAVERSLVSDFRDFYEDALQHKLISFVIGVQGSGTKLFSRLLEETLDFSVIRDRCLIFQAAVKVHQDNSPKNIEKQFWYVHRRLFPATEFHKRLSVKQYHHQNGHFTGIETCFPSAGIRTAREFVYFFYSYHAYRHGKSNLAAKSDDIWEYAHYLAPLLGPRRYFLLVRDFRDNALSIVNKNFGPCTTLQAAAYVRRQLGYYCREADANAGRTLTVHYETILQDPVRVCRTASDRFSLPLTPSWDNRIAQLNIRAGNFNKWRNLDDSNLARCESELREYLQRFGYDTRSTPTRAVDKYVAAWDQIQDICLRVPQRIGVALNRLLSTS